MDVGLGRGLLRAILENGRMDHRLGACIAVACVAAMAAGAPFAAEADVNDAIREGTLPYVNQQVSVSDCVLRIQLRYPGQCRSEAPEVGLLGKDIRLSLTEFSDAVTSRIGPINGIPYIKLEPLRAVEGVLTSAEALARQLVVSGDAEKYESGTNPVDSYLTERGVLSRVYLLTCAGNVLTMVPTAVEFGFDVTAGRVSEIGSELSSYARNTCRD